MFVTSLRRDRYRTRYRVRNIVEAELEKMCFFSQRYIVTHPLLHRHGEIEVDIELEKELDKELDLEAEEEFKSDFSFFRKFFQNFFHLLSSTLQPQTPLTVVFQSILYLDIFLF